MSKKQKILFVSVIVALFLLVLGINNYLTKYAMTNHGDIVSIRATYWASIIGSFVAGILTLFGVIFTILYYKKSDREQNRLQHMPYMQVSFGDYISSDKTCSFFPDMLLSIGRANDPNCPTSGKSITITNIGLGLAVNLKCKWIAEGSHADYSLETSLLKQDESTISTFIISAGVPTENPQSAEGKLVICFDDFLGNHYEQPVEMSFEIHSRSISLIQYDAKAPQYIEG